MVAGKILKAALEPALKAWVNGWIACSVSPPLDGRVRLGLRRVASQTCRVKVLAKGVAITCWQLGLSHRVKRGLDYQSSLWMWVSNTTFLPPHRWVCSLFCSLLYFQARNLSKVAGGWCEWLTSVTPCGLCVLVKGGLSQVRKSTRC